jgi:hypothetical protein
MGSTSRTLASMGEYLDIFSAILKGLGTENEKLENLSEQERRL